MQTPMTLPSITYLSTPIVQEKQGMEYYCTRNASVQENSSTSSTRYAQELHAAHSHTHARSLSLSHAPCFPLLFFWCIFCSSPSCCVLFQRVDDGEAGQGRGGPRGVLRHDQRPHAGHRGLLELVRGHGTRARWQQGAG